MNITDRFELVVQARAKLDAIHQNAKDQPDIPHLVMKTMDAYDAQAIIYRGLLLNFCRHSVKLVCSVLDSNEYGRQLATLADYLFSQHREFQEISDALENAVDHLLIDDAKVK